MVMSADTRLQGYNSAMQNALNSFQTDVSNSGNLFNVGTALQEQNTQNQQAPMQAQNFLSSLLQALPSTSNSSSKSSSTNGLLPALGGGSGMASLYKASDISLKENIIPLGQENGYNVYEFNYIGEPERYRGVMAQEVQKTRPDAVVETPNGLAVNYEAIGVKFARVK
jgi:hypothetical protein